MKRLGLLSGRKLTKAAEVLFCDPFMLEFQAAVFAGTDKITFLDIRSFKGNIFSLREQAENYIKEHIKWRAEIKSGPRKEIPEIPVEAIREAVGNSLCHRDYANPKGNEVAIFKDRIEIYNPGQFPDELDPEDFIKGKGHSILRNPLIAEVMFRSEDIEKWASGIKRIYSECEANRVKVEFNRLKTGFVVVFHRPKWEEGEGLEEGGQKRWPENYG
jgi:ATP-dependent DNA helicase RecG